MYRSTDSYLDDEEIIISVPLPVSYEQLRASVLFRQARFLSERYREFDSQVELGSFFRLVSFLQRSTDGERGREGGGRGKMSAIWAQICSRFRLAYFEPPT